MQVKDRGKGASNPLFGLWTQPAKTLACLLERPKMAFNYCYA